MGVGVGRGALTRTWAYIRGNTVKENNNLAGADL